jgi:hypothetical protein
MLEFDDLMSRRRKVTASSLASSWGTSAKTVQRFIGFLREECKAPLEFDHSGKTYRYRDPDYRVPWLPIQGKDLFAIGVAASVLQIYEGTPAARDMKAIFAGRPEGSCFRLAGSRRRSDRKCWSKASKRISRRRLSCTICDDVRYIAQIRTLVAFEQGSAL